MSKYFVWKTKTQENKRRGASFCNLRSFMGIAALCIDSSSSLSSFLCFRWILPCSSRIRAHWQEHLTQLWTSTSSHWKSITISVNLTTGRRTWKSGNRSNKSTNREQGHCAASDFEGGLPQLEFIVSISNPVNTVLVSGDYPWWPSLVIWCLLCWCCVVPLMVTRRLPLPRLSLVTS